MLYESLIVFEEVSQLNQIKTMVLTIVKFSKEHDKQAPNRFLTV